MVFLSHIKWKLNKPIILIFFLLIFFNSANAIYIKSNGIVQIDGMSTKYTKINENFSVDSLSHYNYLQSKSGILNYGASKNPIVLKFVLTNLTKYDRVSLYLPVPYLDEMIVFDSIEFNSKHSIISGSDIDSSDSNDPYPGADIFLKYGESRTIYIYLKSSKQYILPIQFATTQTLSKTKNIRNIFYGGFVGIMVCMFLYNLVLAFYTKERNYIFYICYIVSITIAQIAFLGVNYYIFPDSSWLSDPFLFIGSSTAGIFGALFAISFLKLKQYLKGAYYFFLFVIVLYFLVFVLYVLGLPQESYQFIQLSGLLGAAVSIYSSTKLSIKGVRSAKIYLISWSILIIGLIAYAIKDFGIIPTSNFSNFSFPIGVTLETILLSIALADQINTLKKDNERAQERIIEEMSRNENLIKNQNIILEDKVKSRTEELEHTLSNLKKAQVKLVESEKMASLGVLTAGIAHEINNPINYVSANVIPLRENIKLLTDLINAYKELTPQNFDAKSSQIIELEKEIELDYTLTETEELINGIEEGAKRTYNIVDGLRTFSRSDTTAKKMTNINKGIESTLSVLKSQVKAVNLQLSLDPNLPQINCQLGKLNQVFLNVVNNALHAIEEKFETNTKAGILGIKTYSDETNVYVEVSDNGKGIPDEFKSKIFEPFYTSKPVGKGTGLGLSISYSIIEDHNGSLSFESEENIGTTFKIQLPVQDAES